jgi:hypothetical protein
MYHLVYLTTNLVNNKIYVGVHSTYNLNDGYLGSGKVLKASLKKYRRKNFKRDILFHCLEPHHAYEIESMIVTEDFITLDNTYNFCIGGKGGAKNFSEESKAKMSLTRKGRPAHNKGVPMSTEQKDKISCARTGFKCSEETKNKVSEAGKGKVPWNKGTSSSEETKLKQSNAMKIKSKTKCPHCNREFNGGNYANSHGDKCKLNPAILVSL